MNSPDDFIEKLHLTFSFKRASQTSMQAQFIFISEGYNRDGQIVNDVERYDSMRDRWESLPRLNVARCFHSSCTLGNTLYVLGGKDENRQLKNSFEKLGNIAGPVQDTFSRWQLIQPN